MISLRKADSIFFWPACCCRARVLGREKYISSTRPSSCRILRSVRQIHIYFERKSAKSGRCRSYVMSRCARAHARVRCRNIPIRVQPRVILWEENGLVERQAAISNSHRIQMSGDCHVRVNAYKSTRRNRSISCKQRFSFLKVLNLLAYH